MNFKPMRPNRGDFIQVTSDTWLVFDGERWREMTVEEQLEASK